MPLHPMRQTDLFYFVDVFFCLPAFTFQLLCFLVLPSYKTQRPPCAELSSEYLTTRHHFLIPPTTHMLCVCFSVRVICASNFVLIAI